MEHCRVNDDDDDDPAVMAAAPHWRSTNLSTTNTTAGTTCSSACTDWKRICGLRESSSLSSFHSSHSRSDSNNKQQQPRQQPQEQEQTPTLEAQTRLGGTGTRRLRHRRRPISPAGSSLVDCDQDGPKSVGIPSLTKPPSRRRFPRFRRKGHFNTNMSTNTTPSAACRWLIPSNHPLKVLWDVLTMLLSFVAAYLTHASIRDRSFGTSTVVVGTTTTTTSMTSTTAVRMFMDLWFIVDVLLNFCTEHKTADGMVLRNGKAVWARYLTTWFVVDALSLLPWENVYVKPIIDMQNRRHFLKRYFFRTRAVIRVSRVLRGRHVRWFGQVAKHTKRAGVGANRLLRLLIIYVPKYLLFYRNMKGVLAVRVLRQVHWMRKVVKNFFWVRPKQDDATDSLTQEEDHHFSSSQEDDSEYRFLGMSDEEAEDDDELDGWDDEVVFVFDDALIDDDDDDGSPF